MLFGLKTFICAWNGECAETTSRAPELKKCSNRRLVPWQDLLMIKTDIVVVCGTDAINCHLSQRLEYYARSLRFVNKGSHIVQELYIMPSGYI